MSLKDAIFKLKENGWKVCSVEEEEGDGEHVSVSFSNDEDDDWVKMIIDYDATCDKTVVYFGLEEMTSVDLLTLKAIYDLATLINGFDLPILKAICDLVSLIKSTDDIYTIERVAKEDNS